MDFDKADHDLILVLHAAFDLSNLLPKSRQWLVWVKTLFKTQMNKNYRTAMITGNIFV